MELRHLRYFEAVAREKNFHRAADSLNVSQPPLSVTIKQLEHEIGADLFIREKKRIKLTPAGHTFLRHTRPILKNVKIAVEEARLADQGKIGTINIAFVGSSMMGYLQAAVRQYKELYPRVVLKFHQSVNEDIIRGIKSEEYDIGVVRCPISLPSSIEMFKEEKENFCAVLPCNHPLAEKNRKTIKLEEIADDKFVYFPREYAPELYDRVMSLYYEKGLKPKFHQEAIEGDTIIGLVASGVGVSITFECMRAINVPGVVYVGLSDVEVKSSVATIAAKSDDPLIKNFIDVI